MNTRIENLLSEIATQMQGCLAKRDFESVTKFSTLLNRVQILQKRAIELNSELSDIETTLKGGHGDTAPKKVTEILQKLGPASEDPEEFGRAGHQTLRIEIDWRANGKAHEKEIIFLPRACDSMVHFLNRVVEEFGQDAVQKLTHIRINRGPLLSKTPARDFLNRTQGRLYSHKRLRGTDYFVLTHSQTSQKLEDVNRICRVLGFAPGSVQVRAESRYAAEYVV